MSGMHGYPSGSLAAINHKLVHAGMYDSSIHKLPVPQVMHCDPYRYDVCRGREFKIRHFQLIKGRGGRGGEGRGKGPYRAGTCIKVLSVRRVVVIYAHMSAVISFPPYLALPGWSVHAPVQCNRK